MIKQIVNFAVFFSLLMPVCAAAKVQVAVIAPKSGDYRDLGSELIEGAVAAVEEINASGGLKGKKLEVRAIDDACSENLAVSTAQMLSVSGENKPQLVVGPYCSEGFDKVADIYSKAQIFQIVPTALSYRFEADDSHGIVKVMGFKEQASRDLFSFYNKNFAGSRLALLSNSKNPDSVNSVKLVWEEFRKHGKASLLRNYDFNDYDGDLERIASQIVDSGEELVFIAGNPRKAGKIIRNVKRINGNMSFFLSKFVATSDFFENAADYLDTVYFMALPSAEETPELAETLVNLRLKGINFRGLNIYGYASIKMWAELVDKAGSLSYGKLSREVRQGTSQTLWGRAFFNNGNNANMPHYIFYRYENGDFMPVTAKNKMPR